MRKSRDNVPSSFVAEQKYRYAHYMKQKHSGSCLCNKVTFKIEGDFESFYLCHCKYCRKDTGSAHAANLFSSKSRLTWNKGEENVNTFNLPGTQHTKSFCKDCGAALPSIQMDGKLLVVPAGSLDSELSFEPNAHIYFSSRATWDDGLGAIQKFDELPV